jgi:integrase/recombinase XerD
LKKNNLKQKFLKKVPKNVPIKINGKVNKRIVIKKDYVRNDGTCALYLSVSINGKRKRIPLNISVHPSKFNTKNQRIKGKSQVAVDSNMLIGQALARINDIELTYRLSNRILDVVTLQKEYINPTPNYDFIKFYEYELQHQKKYLMQSTYRQQVSTLNKLKSWKSYIAFSAIDENLIKEMELHFKNVLKNKKVTIASSLKNFKKYLHIANNKGINTSLSFNDIKVPNMTGSRTYLDKDEIRLFYNYWRSDFIKLSHRLVLSKFLFSVFTSLRISDIQNIKRENIIGDFLAYNSSKTGKFNKIKLSDSALQFINHKGELFSDNYSGEHINRALKEIALFLAVNKKVSFHVARHTFATQYIINGGNVVNLQKIMGHSNIRETMIYVHIVDRLLNDEIDLLDNILK